MWDKKHSMPVDNVRSSFYARVLVAVHTGTQPSVCYIFSLLNHTSSAKKKSSTGISEVYYSVNGEGKKASYILEKTR